MAELEQSINEVQTKCRRRRSNLQCYAQTSATKRNGDPTGHNEPVVQRETIPFTLEESNNKSTAKAREGSEGIGVV